MISESHLSFLQEKIHELRSALFFSLSNAVLKMQTTIITALKVDEVGQVWFFVNRPLQHIQEFDKEFPARLEFFKKGKSFYLKIAGKACIVNDPEEVNSLVAMSDDIRQKAMSEMVLVKVKIQNVEYVDNTPAEGFPWLQAMKVMFGKLFRTQQAYRPYTLQPAH